MSEIKYPVTVNEFLTGGTYGESFVCKDGQGLLEILQFMAEEESLFSVEDVDGNVVEVKLVDG